MNFVTLDGTAITVLKIDFDYFQHCVAVTGSAVTFLSFLCVGYERSQTHLSNELLHLSKAHL